jgi:hypothetical protein
MVCFLPLLYEVIFIIRYFTLNDGVTYIEVWIS